MLKRIMKTAVAASLVFGMSYTAIAEVNVGGSFREYFGQFSTGKTGSAGYFQSYGETNLKISGKSGKMSMYYELESKANTPSEYLSATQRKVSYESSFGLISIGTIVNMAGVPLSLSNAKTSDIPGSTHLTLGYGGYNEANGLDIMMPLGAATVEVTLYSKSRMKL